MGAAPLCSSVFSNAVISDGKIAAVVQEIAELKMKADLAQAKGVHGLSSAQKAIFASSSKEKYQKLVSRLSGRYSESEIKAMISAKIHEMQQAKGSRDGKEKEIRDIETEKRNLFYPHYKLKDHIDVTIAIDDSKSLPEMFHYFHRSKNALVESDGRIVFYENRGPLYSVLSLEYARVKVSADETKIYLLDTLGEINVFDVPNNKFLPFKHEAIKIDFSKLPAMGFDVDPSGSFMLIRDLKGIAHIVNMLDGTVRLFDQSNSAIPDVMNSPRFVDSETIVSYSGNTLNFFNWKQNTNQTIDNKEAITQLYLSQDQQQVTVIGGKKVSTFDLKDLSKPISMVGSTWPEHGLVSAKLLPQKELLFVEGSSTEPHFDVYPVTDFSQPRFSFADYLENVKAGGAVPMISAVSFSPDGKSAAFVVKELRTQKTYIDIWERAE
jgi:hypothetical protein